MRRDALRDLAREETKLPEDRSSGLESQLGAPIPAGLAELQAEHLQELAEAVRQARRRQAAELKAASEQALRHIPRVLRLPLRRVIG